MKLSQSNVTVRSFVDFEAFVAFPKIAVKNYLLIIFCIK